MPVTTSIPYGSDSTILTDESTADFSIYPIPLGSDATNFFTSAEEARDLGGVLFPEKTSRDQIAFTCADDLPEAF
jgi:hypothetical protein